MAAATNPIADEVYDFIDDPARIDEINDLIERHGLGDGAFDVVAPIQDMVAQGRMDPARIPERLKTLGLEAAAAHALTEDVIKTMLMPIRPYLPHLEPVIAKWGIEEPDVPVRMAGSDDRPDMTADQFVDALVNEFHLELPDHVLQDRFEDLLLEFATGKVDEAGALTRLSRSTKVGGLGLNEAASRQLLDGFAARLKEVNIVDESSPAAVEDVGPSQPEPEPAPRNPKPLPRKKVVKPLAEIMDNPPSLDDLMKEAEKRRVSKVVSSDEQGEPPTIDELVATAKPKPASAASKKSPPRPVFDPTTFHPDDEKELAEHAKRTPSAEPIHDMGSAVESVLKKADVGAFLSDAQQQRLRTIVETRLKGVRDQYATRRALEAAENAGGLALEGRVLTQLLEQIESAYGSLKRVEKNLQAKDKQAYVAKRQERHQVEPSAPLPTPNIPKVTPKRAPPRPQGKVTDIVTPKRLSGPVEELGAMSLAEFRRLASDPASAAQKVLEIFDTLESQSYGKRMEGVRAWRSSPIYQMYLSLVAEGMTQGKSLEVILALRRKHGEDVFSEEEIQSLLKINKALKH